MWYISLCVCVARKLVLIHSEWCLKRILIWAWTNSSLLSSLILEINSQDPLLFQQKTVSKPGFQPTFWDSLIEIFIFIKFCFTTLYSRICVSPSTPVLHSSNPVLARFIHLQFGLGYNLQSKWELKSLIYPRIGHKQEVEVRPLCAESQAGCPDN